MSEESTTCSHAAHTWAASEERVVLPAAAEDGLRPRSTGQIFGRLPVVAVINRIDAAHRFLADLFFDDMRDHENAVERRGIYSQVSENRADRSVLTLMGSDFLGRRMPSQPLAPTACQVVNSRVSLGSSRLNDFS